MKHKFATKKISLRAQAAIRRILPATIAVINEVGLQETSISRVSERAGMSRGAVLHHYKTKIDLVVGAYEHLLADQITQIRQTANSVSGDSAPLDSFLRDLWERYRGPLLMVTLDYLSMARTNDELRAQITPLALKFNIALNDIWQELVAESNIVGAKASAYLNLTLCFARGMGIQSIWRNEQPYFDTLIDEWRHVLDAKLN